MHVGTNLTGFYEKTTFSMPFSSELCYGTELEILEEQGRWVFTRQKDGYLGWAYKPYLSEGSATEPTHYVVVSSYGLRTQPDRESEIMTRVVSGTGITIQVTQGEWAQVTANKTGWMPVRFLRGIDELPQSVEEKRKALLKDSARMRGGPYFWGGT